MHFEEILQKLHDIKPSLELITIYWNNAKFDEQRNELELKSQDPILWNNPQEHGVLLKKLQQSKSQHEQYLALSENFNELYELINLFSQDENELERLKIETYLLIGSIKSFKLNLLLDDEIDNVPCFLSINSGAGGTESQDWSQMILRMYSRFCEKMNYTVSIVDYQDGEGAGIKSATLYIKGKNAYGFLKGEHGIHRLVRISPFDSNKRRHTSFCGVFVIPELAKVELIIEPSDLRIDTFRAGGAGGQHVNKTESAIRITHIPSGIVVQCQNERSQGQNKETAMKMLKSKLAQKMKDEAKSELNKTEKKNIEWGSQIRSYILHPYKMVKDHRTNYESGQPELILDGDLMPVIESVLVN